MNKLAFAIVLTGAALAQQTTTSPKKPEPGQKPPAAAASQLTSRQTVEMFMQRMFGQDPSVKWQVGSIGPSPIPDVTQVLLLVGDPPRPTNLFIMPDQKFAVAGEALPFGADPFAPVRERLQAEAHGQSRGPDNAAITIVEFGDLQCPSCRAAYPVLEQLRGDFPQSRFVFQHYPLAKHNWAMQAAAYAECVDQQSHDAFWKFVNSVYDAQPEINETNASAKLSDLATKAGVDATKVVACSKSPDVAEKIQRSIGLGQAVGVSGTPTVYVNGRKIASVVDVPYQSLKQLIEFEAKMAAR
jgi:protein-disulfide isomerase